VIEDLVGRAMCKEGRNQDVGVKEDIHVLGGFKVETDLRAV